MRFALEFHPLVRHDLAEAELWYTAIDPRLADRILDAMQAAFADLQENALLYRPRFDDIRRVNPPVFQYGVFYFIHEQSVVVLGALHAARDTAEELLRRRTEYA